MEGQDQPPPPAIGRYRVRAKLGSGGMAEVFLAFLEGPQGFVKPVAIKRIKPTLATHSEFVKLFLTEAKTGALLSHPNICQVHELDEVDNGQYFMVLEYLLGVPLTQVLVKQMSNTASFPLGFLIGVVVQACEGMHFAHRLCDKDDKSYNIVHRDLSPPNIFLTSTGMAKILDFGISKSTQSVVETMTGQIRGKFSYMSPEQLRGHDLDPRSDVFSLAIIVHELLTGQRLFRRSTRLETFSAVTKGEIPRVSELNPRVPEVLADAVALGLSRDRDERFASARAFGTALTRAVQSVDPIWSSPQIAEFGEKAFASEFEAHRRWLEDAQAGQKLSAPPQALHADDYTEVDDHYADDARVLSGDTQAKNSSPDPAFALEAEIRSNAAEEWQTEVEASIDGARESE